MQTPTSPLPPYSFNDPAPEACIDFPRPERLLKGNPRRVTRSRYEADGVYIGEWECEAGAWRIQFAADEHEFFQVIHGHCRVSDTNGNGKDYRAGDACIIPPGFAGVFEVIEPVLKRYVIVQPG